MSDLSIYSLSLYILEALDTQASNENPLINHVLIWFYSLSHINLRRLTHRCPMRIPHLNVSLFGLTADRYIHSRRPTHRRPMRISYLNHVIYTLCSYWLSCCTGPFGGISRHSLYKFGSNGPLASSSPNSHPPRVPPYSSMTSGFQFTGYWYSLFP